MKILVTGHRGLLGSACVRVLSKNHEVVTTPIDLFHSSLFHDWLEHANVDAVVHCAAKVGGVKANRDMPVDFMRDNIAINDTVIGAAGACGIKKLVNIGTSCMYPKNSRIPVREEYIMTGPLEPAVEAYATAKLAAYQLCRSYNAQYGKSFITVCPCNLYGINDNYGPSAHVIPALIAKLHKSIQSGGDLYVWGDGSAVREFMTADDAARGIEVVLTSHNAPELINLGSGVATSIIELINTLCNIVGHHPNVVWQPSEPVGIQAKTFDISLLTSLGFKPQDTMHQGLAMAWTDFTNNPNKRLK